MKKKKSLQIKKDSIKDNENINDKEIITEVEEINDTEENIEDVIPEEEPYVFERYIDTDINEGLSSEVVLLRQQNGYANVVEANLGKSIGRIITDNIFTFFNLLYVIITILLVIAQSWNNLTFLGVIIPNTIIGIVQEIKAKKMIDKLSLVTAPKATVIRDSEKFEIPTNEVVIDDIVVFTSGDQIYSDCIVSSGVIEVNESLITGESDAITKNPGDLLFSGSFLSSGSCYARVEHIGKDNYIEKLASEAKKHQPPKSELLRSLKLIIRLVAFIIIPLGLLTFTQAWNDYSGADMGFFAQYTFATNRMAAVVIGMIPSGLFLLTSIALAVGVVNLAKNKTLVQELYCIEMLARVDVLCLDKTGTITDGTMRVVDCIEVKNTTEYTIREIVGSMMNTFEDTNATSDSLIRYFDKNNVLHGTNILPFSSKRKYSAISFENPKTHESVGSFYLGAPEFVLNEQYDKIKSRVERFAAQGCRVLALAHTNAGIKESGTPRSLKVLALIVIQDHIREEAPSTIEYFRKNGVDVKVISGDNALTVSEISSRAGIENANRFISLEGLSDEEVYEIAFDYTVFGRVSPTQKRVLVQALKDGGRTVAMTGDGVNDILALKEADCSIGMASGSEAVRYISHLVLLDSNFASMPKVVAEGRRVINNIQRTSTLFLVKTIFTILLTIMYLVLGKVLPLGIGYPFEASQLFLIEFFAIGFPATFLALLPNYEKVKGKFLPNVLRSTLPGALTIVLFHGIMYSLMQIFNWDQSIYSTLTIILTTTICIFVLYRVSKPFNWLKTIVFIFVVVACIIAVVFFGDVQLFGKPFLKIVLLNRENTILLLLMMQSAYFVMMLIEQLLAKLSHVKN